MHRITTIFNNILDVPYYAQTMPSTCGPACLMMVMRYWNPDLQFSRRLEFNLWRRSKPLLFFGGTLQFGLAEVAAEEGFHAEIFQKRRWSSYHKHIHQILDLVEDAVRAEALKAGVRIVYGKTDLDLIRSAIQKKIPPIVFINLEPLIDEDVYHWLIVTGFDDRSIYVNDPYLPKKSDIKKKNFRLSLQSFIDAMNTDSGPSWRIPPCIILVYR